MTDFVGRRQEIAQFRRLLSEARLIVLTGAGGTGKTRLALRVAAEVRRGYPDGVWLVDLAPVLEEAIDYASRATGPGPQVPMSSGPVPTLLTRRELAVAEG